MQRLLALLFLAAAVPGVVHAQPADWQKTWEETLAAAKKEGKVVVAGPPDAQVRKELPEAFEARYGIKMEYISARGTDQANKLRRERGAGVYAVDAILAGNQTLFSVLLPEKMLAPLKPEIILPEVTDGKYWKRGSLWFADPEQQYILRIFNTVREAFMINTREVKSGDLRKFTDLLDPKWKGKISFLDPSVAGTGGNQGALLYTLFGEEFMKKLFVDQQPMITRERRQLTDAVLRGSYPIAFGAEDGEIERLRAEGQPVDTIYGLEDMPGSVSGGNMVGLMDQAPHPNAAKVFVNWIASKEGSEIYGRGLKMVPARTDIDAAKFMPPEVIPKSGVNYFDVYGYEFTTLTNAESRRRMRDIMRKQ
jgi:ABC-type Fe3+ transport system substrate-binding protein